MSDLFARAEELREADAYQSAIALYHQLLAEGHDTPDIQFGIGQCYGKSYQFDVALEHLRRAFSADPARVSGANYYAYILERNGLFDEAGRWYDVALAHPVGGPEDLWTRSHYCWYLEKAGRDADARAAYAAFLTANPTYTWGVKRYALLLLRQGAYDHAEGVMQAAVQRMPSSPFPKLNLLEFALLADRPELYDAALASLQPLDALPLPVAVTADLFAWWRSPSAEGSAALEAKAAELPESVHRDFDDLTEALAARGGDTKEWARLLHLLLK
jgi:tetratricopeptide (TPR) repeat protein